MTRMRSGCLMVRLPVALAAEDRAQLEWLAKLVDIRLHQQAEMNHLYDAVSRLAQAERLQRALFAIANQASAGHDMDHTMRAHPRHRRHADVRRELLHRAV